MNPQHLHRLFLLLGLPLLVACDALRWPGELLQEAGDGVSPAFAGPFAVGWKPNVRVKRLILPDFNMDVYYPSLSDGSFDFSQAPYPVVVLLPDDGVWVDEYATLAGRLGSWGMVVAVPDVPWNLPGLGPFRPGAVLDRLNKSMQESTFWQGGLDLSRAALGGVGAGGSVADALTMSDTRFDAWFLLVGAPSVPPADRAGPVLLLGGSSGCDGLPEDFEAQADAYASPYLWARIPGLTREGLTDPVLSDGDPTNGESSSEDACAVETAPETLLGQLSAILIPFLMHYVADDPTLDDWLFSPPADITLHGMP